MDSMTRSDPLAALIPASQDIYRKIVFEIADGIIGIDEGGIIRLCNPAAENIFGWPAGELVDKPLELLLPARVQASHQQLVNGFRSGGSEARHMGQRNAGIVGRRADGAEIDLGITILRTSAAGEPMMIAVIRDISHHVRYQNDLKRLAETDSLSGLLNRRAFRSRALDSLARQKGDCPALALFDLDDFKGVNDRYGHDAGDEVIRRFSDIMRDVAGASGGAAAGRWGGEEFILFMPPAAEAADAKVERIRAAFSATVFHFPGHAPVSLTVSAGLAAGAGSQGDLDGMIAAADKALYEAKRGGRNRLVRTGASRQALAS